VRGLKTGPVFLFIVNLVRRQNLEGITGLAAQGRNPKAAQLATMK
jgi:hypothetical protein